MAKHLLSKSTFMYGVQCPLRLYLHKFKPHLRNPEDEAQQAIYTTGTNVGLLAQGVFPDGVDVTPPDAFSYPIAAEKTQEAIKNGAEVIYEATFYFDGIMCAVDILVKQNNKWKAYEVKSVNNIKNQHILDASLQYYVLTNSGLPLEDFSIMHFNKEYVKRGEIEVKELFAATSVSKEILANQKFIKNKAEELKRLVTEKKEPFIVPGAQCEDPYPCDFFNHCWKNVPEETVDYGQMSVNEKDIKDFLNGLEYPLHFFDFETVGYAVPVFDESRPYQAVPFQYSLHKIDSADTQTEHYYFLGDSVNDPREELIKSLIKDVGNKGSILVWYKPFEISRLKELACDFPNYENELNKIIDRIVDLRDPFRLGYYYHPDFEGSTSIKAVLPVLIPELSYGDLEIQEGGTASLTYAELSKQSAAEQKRLRKALLEYCHLDTLAMVKIFEKLSKI